QAFSLGNWLRGLAAGRTSVSAGRHVFLRFTLQNLEVGSELALASGDAPVAAAVDVHATEAIDDTVELVVNGVVGDSLPVTLAAPGATSVTFPSVTFPASAWVAARLGSERAHTAALYVVVDGRPIADPLAAEYWMLWCDVVSKTTLDHLEVEFFGNQLGDAL